jgi:hypothetical protein
MNAKRTVYLLAFVVFGVLAQFLVHAGLEMIVIELLIRDYNRYGLGLSWSQWYAAHAILTVLLFAMGAVFGYRQGVYWWNVIYVEKRFGWPPKWKGRGASSTTDVPR